MWVELSYLCTEINQILCTYTLKYALKWNRALFLNFALEYFLWIFYCLKIDFFQWFLRQNFEKFKKIFKFRNSKKGLYFIVRNTLECVLAKISLCVAYNWVSSTHLKYVKNPIWPPNKLGFHGNGVFFSEYFCRFAILTWCLSFMQKIVRFGR